ncbi:hypothetical protein BKA70DRAFT_1500328 [Coprinopsis sp. MPI-PUGE-AT-0042]|nr:hypothetical protein BKA70DRAFT_1500328 [Coprinopsis sp. MPI-PUGE-AT-0042]
MDEPAPPKSTSDLAVKRAETRRKNLERQLAEARLLEEQTKDGRTRLAKQLADKQSRESSNHDELKEHKAQKKGGKGDPEGTLQSISKKGKRHQGVNQGKRVPRAPVLDASGEDEEPPQMQSCGKKARQKGATKGRDTQIAGSEESESNSIEELSAEDNSEKSSGSEGEGELSEGMLQTECPQVIEDEDDHEMADNDQEIRLSHRPSPRPPHTSDVETDYQSEKEGASKQQNGVRKRSRSQVEVALTDEDQEAPSQSKKGRKKRRDEAFDEEKPGVGAARNIRTNKTSKSHQASKVTHASPAHVALKKPSTNNWRDINLTQQPSLVQEVVRNAINTLTYQIFFRDAWPEIFSRTSYGRPILLGAANAVMEENPQAIDVRNQVENDDMYVKTLAYILLGRIALLRTPAKVAGANSIPWFRLGLGDECGLRVESLLKDRAYVFPGSWKQVEGKETNIWVPNGKEPYMSPAIIDTLKQGFFSPSHNSGTHVLDGFPTHREARHMSIPLLALAATGVHYGLYQFKDGAKDNTLTFSGNLFLGVYEGHHNNLQGILQKSPRTFHRVMSTIFTLTAGSSVKRTNISGGGDFFSIIELDEESDS